MGLFSYGPSEFEYVKCRHCGELIIESTQVCMYCNGTAPGIYTKCPGCESTNYVWHKAGFNWVGAATGAIALGPVGLINGILGSTACECICLKCGQGWMPTGPNHNVAGTKTRRFQTLPDNCYSITAITLNDRDGNIVAVLEDGSTSSTGPVIEFFDEGVTGAKISIKHKYDTNVEEKDKVTTSPIAANKAKTFTCEQCSGIVYYNGSGNPTVSILCPKCKKKQKKESKRGSEKLLAPNKVQQPHGSRYIEREDENVKRYKSLPRIDTYHKNDAIKKFALNMSMDIMRKPGIGVLLRSFLVTYNITGSDLCIEPIVNEDFDIIRYAAVLNRVIIYENVEFNKVIEYFEEAIDERDIRKIRSIRDLCELIYNRGTH